MQVSIRQLGPNYDVQAANGSTTMPCFTFMMSLHSYSELTIQKLILIVVLVLFSGIYIATRYPSTGKTLTFGSRVKTESQPKSVD